MDNDGNILGAVQRRRSRFEHWYHPGADTPLGYFAARFVLYGLMVFGGEEAVTGHGWHYRPEFWLPAVVDGSWHAKALWRRLRLRRGPRHSAGA